MLDFDAFREIFLTIGKNKLRTFLTGFSIAWGILLLVAMLTSGNGLKNGVLSNFSGRAQNTVTVMPGITSVSYDGFLAGRRIKFNYKDYDLLTQTMPEVKNVTPRVTKPSTLTYENEYGLWDIEGTTPDIMAINNLWVGVGNGRFINKLDIQEKRKVIVITDEMKRILFRNKNPIGKFVIADEVVYEVVGVYDKNDQFKSKLPAYVPFSTAQSLYAGGVDYHKIDFMIFGFNTVEANEQFNKLLRERFGKLHRFDPADRSALFIRNTFQSAIQTNQILSLIDFFVIIVGIASLVAGIVGVSNIMVIAVKERTKEIGICKAIGAPPFSVVRNIILESTLITTISGYIGLILGMGYTEILGSTDFAQGNTQGIAVFKDPSIDLRIAFIAIIIMVISGILAGLVPAIRAAKISPIAAMRDE